MPSGWTTDGSGTWSVGAGDYSSSTGAGNGEKNAKITHGTSGNSTKLITPAIDLSGVSSAELSFMHVQRSWSGDIDQLRVYYRASATDAWTLLDGQEYTAAVGSWTTVEGINLPNLSSTYQIAFEMTDRYGYGVGIDYVRILPGPSCVKPSGLKAALTLGNGSIASLSWTAGGSETAWKLHYSTDAEFGSYNEVSASGSPIANLEGLTAEQLYYARVKADCGGDESEWSNVITFTPTDIYSLTVNEGTSTNSSVPIQGVWTDNNIHSQFVIPAADLASIQWAELTELTFFSSNSTIDWGDAEFEVYVAEINSTTISALVEWTSLTKVMNAAPLSIKNGEMIVTFDTPYQYKGGNLLIGFDQTVSGSYVSSTWYGISASGASMGGHGTSVNQQNFLPKMKIIYVPGEEPACIPVSNLEKSNVTAHTANLSWTENGEATAWQICLNGDENNLINVTANTYELTELTAETAYAVKVRANCGGNNGVSEWSNEINFTTEVACEPLASISISNIERISMTVNLIPQTGLELAEDYELVYATTELSDAEKETHSTKTSIGKVSSYPINNLERETTYYIYVRANCGSEGPSAWVSASAPTKGLVGCDEVPVGTGTTTTSSTIVTKSGDKYGYGQTLYKASEIGHSGIISSIAYNLSASSANYEPNWIVYMGHTSETSLSTWIPLEELTQVATITTAFTTGWNTIDLTTPFDYNGTDNLVVAVANQTGSYSNSYSNSFYYSAETGSFYYRGNDNDNAYGDPSNTSISGTVSSYKANIKFSFCYSNVACPEVLNLSYVQVGEGKTEAQITWEYSGADYLNGFEIARSENPLDDPSTAEEITVLEPSANSISYTGLSVGTHYYIYVRAICGNSDGNSEWEPFDFTTNADCPLVKNLAVSLNNKTSIHLQWESAYQDQDLYFGYVVDKNELTDEVLKGMVDSYVEETGVNVENLDAGAHYYIYVASMCTDDPSSGPFDFSAFSKTEITMPAACLPVINLTATRVAHNLVELTWDNDPIESETEAPTQWEVGLVGEEGNAKLVNERHAIIFGLQAGKGYEAYVKAKYSDTQMSAATIVDFATTATPEPCQQIGNGTTTEYGPVCAFYGYERNGYIFTAADGLTTSGKIESLSWYGSAAGSIPAKIYLKNTTETAFSTSMIWNELISDATLVWDADVSTANGWYDVDIEDFIFTGNNLMILVASNKGGGGGTTVNSRYFEGVGSASHVYGRKDNSIDDDAVISSLSSKGTNNHLPNTKFCFEQKACPDVTAIAVSGLTNTEATVSWEPMGTETAWTVFISTSQVTDFSGVSPETVNDLSKHFTGLTQGTDYYVYIQPDCSGADFMEIPFTTIATCKAMTSPAVVADSEGPHGATVTWVDLNTVPAGNYTIAYGPAADAFDLENPATYKTAYSSTISAELTGLTGETQYKFAVKANCGGEDESRWSDVATFTTEISCHAPTGAAISSISINSATLSWEDAQNSGATYIVAYGPAATFDITDATTYTREEGIAALSKELTGLNAATSYKACVKSDCGLVDGESHSWSNIVTFTTAYELPFNEQFATTTIPADWARYSGLLSDVMSSAASLSTTTAGWNFGTGNGVFDNHAKINIYGSSVKYWLVTPNICLSQNNIQLSFDLALTSYYNTLDPVDPAQQADDKFVVLISTNDGDSWTSLREWNNTGSEYVYNDINCSAEGKRIAIDLSSYYPNTVKIAFYGESTAEGGDNNLHIDSVKIDLIPDCDKPMGLELDAVTETGASFSWDKTGEDWLYAVALASAGIPADNEFSSDNINVGENLSVAVSGLSDNTDYKFYLRPACGTIEETVNIPFQTKQLAVAVGNGWSDNFENGKNWYLINGSITNAWAYGEAAHNGAGTHALYISNDNGATNAYTVNVAAVVYAVKLFHFEAGKYSFSYDWKAYGEKLSSGPYDYLRVFLVPATTALTAGTTLPSGLTATTLPDGWIALDGGQALNNVSTWQTFVSDDIDIEAGDYKVVLLWRDDTSSGSQTPAAIDNFFITKIACAKPTGLAVSEFTTDGATFTWDNIDGGAWEYAYAPASNEAPAEDDFTPVNTNSVQLSGLTDNTAYTFYLRQDCGNNEKSKAETIPFHTKQLAVAVGDGWSDNLENGNNWMLINGNLTNAWVYGEATHNGEGTHALYISNDGGVTNAYTNNLEAVVFAAKLFQFEDGKYSFSYDWKAYGESYSDYLRVALVPETVELVAATSLSGLSSTGLPTGWIALDGGSKQNLQTEWQSFSSADINIAAGGNYNVVFIWKDDYSAGTNPPAAVDNISIAKITCAKPTDLAVSEIHTTSAKLAWTAEEGQDAWQICLNNDESNLLDAYSNPFVVSTLTAATAYTAKVRAVCGGSNSDWSNAISFASAICEDEDKMAISYELNDSYGDGWSGNKIQVIHKNTNTVIASLTIEDEEYSENGTLNLCCGEEYSLNWVSGGLYSYPDECSFVIKGVQGEEIYKFVKNSTGPTAGVLHEFTMNCPTCLIPTELVDVEAEKTANSITVGWTANGSETAWQICLNGDVENPIDANSNPFTITDLTAETTYSVQVRANCGSGDYSLWSAAANFTTAASCQTPDGIVAADITSTSASISWNTYGKSGFDLQYRELNATEWTMISGATMPQTISGLTANTTYQVQVKVDCKEDWSAIESFKTGYGVPFLEEFGTAKPADWNMYTGLLNDNVLDGTTALTPATYGWSFGTANDVFDNHARVNIYGNYQRWLVTPVIDITAGNMQLTFDQALTLYSTTSTASPTDDDRFVVLISEDYGATWSILREWNNSGSEDVYDEIPAAGAEIAINLNAYNGKSIQLAFYGESTVSGGDYNLHIDNVRIDAVPACPKPKALNAVAASGSAINLTWQKGADETAWDVQYRKQGESIWNDADLSVEVSGNNCSAQLTGLDPQTTYEIQVRANCGDDQSDWIADEETTPCASVALPFVEDFNGLTSGIPECWDNSEGTTTTESYKWKYYATGHEGHGVRFNSYNNNTDRTNFLKTPTLEIEASAILSFWCKNPAGGDFSVYYTIDGGVQKPLSGATGLTGISAWTKKEIALPDECVGHNVVIIFKGTSNYGTSSTGCYLDLDEVRVERALLFLDDHADNSAILAQNMGQTLNVQIGRTFTRTGYDTQHIDHYNTICLPFSLNAEQLAASPIATDDIWRLLYARVDAGADELLYRIARTDHIDAGVPYLIGFPASDEDIVNPIFENVTISATEGQKDGDPDFAQFCGILKPEPFAAGDQTKQFLYTQTNTLYWWNGNYDSQLYGFRAFFLVNTNNNSNNAPIRHGMRSRIIKEEQVATGVENINGEAQTIKRMENGMVVIIRNGVKYSIDGQVISK